MYEYLLENLISYSQVDGNLRRTADRGLVSELYRKQMNALALKCFGVDSNGNYTENKEDIVAYRCPYSGEIISDLSNAHLEHILPVSSNGGTVLFNCIPILDKVNLSKSDESNLLVWWQEQDYFNYDRLERLIQYMLEAYTLAFKEPTEEELYDYDNSLNNDNYIENDDLSIDLKDRISNKTYTNIQQNITYYQLINDLINELSKNRDVSKYNYQLNSLKEQNTFGNIYEIEKVINAVQVVFKEALGEDSKRFLSYSLKIDMNKLLKSLITKDYESEIRERINNIKSILIKFDKNINDYFESIQDIEEINLLYYNNPTQEQITWFINSLKISYETIIETFIEILSNSKYTNYINGRPDSNNIFSYTEVSFEGYEHINGLNIKNFWNNNSDKVLKTILAQKKKLESKENRTQDEEEILNKLNLALKAIDDYEFSKQNNSRRRIEKFIEMLSNPKYTNYIYGLPDSNNIFSTNNKIPFEGYEHINGLNSRLFWTWNSSKIIETIQVQKKELESKENSTQEEEERLKKLNLALKAIDDYDFSKQNNSRRRIEKFIEMLSNPKYTNYINGLPDSNNIFSYENEVSFEGYEHIDGLNIGHFWDVNSNKIIETIYFQKKELESKENRTPQDEEKLNKLNLALKAIDDYDFSKPNSLIRRTEKFIEMLSNPKYTNYINGHPDSNNIFYRDTEVSFEGYEHINGLNTSSFWLNNSNEVLETILAQKKKLENRENRTPQDEEKLNKLNLALKAIDDYDFSNKNNPKRRIEKFIEMLSNPKYTNYINGHPDSNNIFYRDTEVRFEGYEHIDGLKISNFWLNNSDKIIEIIYFQKKELESKEDRTPQDEEKLNKLNLALKAIDDYDFSNKKNIERKIEKFIEMLSNPKYTNYINGRPDNNNIFSYTEVRFEGYEHINGLNIKNFWNNNSDEVLKTILAQKKKLESKENRKQEEEEKLNKLNLALKAIDDFDFYNVQKLERRIEKYIEMLTNPKYTNYINGRPDSNNIFSKNEVSFEGYEHINGLNTKNFWNSNSIKSIIPLLFYNKVYDNKNKTYIESDLNYSSSKYDSARKAVMEYLNYNRRRKKQLEFRTIDEYIDTLEKTKKEVKALIELRNSLLSRKEQLIIENKELTEELNSSYRRAM